MARRKWIVPLVLGLLAGGMHLFYVRNLEGRLTGGAAVDVLVNTGPLARGDVISQEQLATRSVPAAYLDQRVVRLDERHRLLGLSATVALEAGQTLTWTDFLARGPAGAEDLADLIEPGHRAITIPVDASLSMGGLLRPGHRVDILGTFTRGGLAGERVTVTLLQNVPVLATGRDLGGGTANDAKRYSTATLSVGLEESELLAFATTRGSLFLVLRGHQDLEVVRDVPEKGMDDVWDAERRNALQERPRTRSTAIERLRAE